MVRLSNTRTTQTLNYIPQIHIASMVIYCKPEHQKALVIACNALSDSEVYKDTRDTAFILILERTSEGALRMAIDEINAFTGVINVSLVYHHCDSAQNLAEELSS